MSTAARLLRSGLVNVPTTERAVRQRVVSVDGKPVRTGAGRLLPVDGAFTARGLHAGDVVAMPGLGAATEAQAAALLTRPDILRAIALLGRAPTKRVVLAASCSATFVLAASGALDGKQATTTWWLGAAFARRFTRVTLRADKMVIDAGEVLTAGSAFAHADLMLAIVARTLSPSLAHMVARYLVLDERISQARYMVTEHLRGADPTVRELEAFVLANIERQVSVHEMARATATSPRTLARRVEDALGTTPHHLAQRLRVARAVQLLETTGDSVENIAARVGYADAAAFRRVFRRETGEAPRTSRASGFRQAARS
ncbi:GlxA family transcriptional regulator [Myxococcus hansupus]|nr:helix-turn-helix domain-containing protein [Myxococcus hansupus]